MKGYFSRPAWSPDGSQVALSYTPDNFKTLDIRIVNVSDGTTFSLTHDGHSTHPAWTGAAWVGDFPEGVKIGPVNAGGGAGPPNPTGGTGDVNGDGKVDITDAVLALQFAVGARKPGPAQAAAADFNGDGRIDVRYVVLILRKAVGL